MTDFYDEIKAEVDEEIKRRGLKNVHELLAELGRESGTVVTVPQQYYNEIKAEVDEEIKRRGLKNVHELLAELKEIPKKGEQQLCVRRFGWPRKNDAISSIN